MLSPSYSITATERVLPRLALDFTTAVLDPRVTFARSGNTATVIDSTGVIVAVNADIPRFDYNPTTLVCKGLLIEESRTNVLLNSSLDGTSLETQAVVVTAAARTLTFYGTGQIVLSGAASATVTGTGAYPTRTTLTFTPSAGILTLTVTGTVQFAQLELGSFATSFIPTAASQVTRNADVATMTGTNFSGWFNASEGTFVFDYTKGANLSANIGFVANDGTAGNRIAYFNDASSAAGSNDALYVVTRTSSAQASLSLGALTVGTQYTVCLGYKQNDFAASVNKSSPVTDVSGTPPTVTQLEIGSIAGASNLNSHIASLMYYPQKLTNAEIQAFSA
jgi:hypothetical protein